MSVTPSKGYCSSARLAIPVSAYAEVKAADFGVSQHSLPSISGNTAVDYMFVVGNSSSQWKVQKSVHYINPDGSVETTGIVKDAVGVEAPEYPGASQSVSSSTPTYFVSQSVLYVCSTTGTTGSSYPTLSTGKNALTTDGSAVWKSLGRAILIRVRFANVTVSDHTPASQEYDFYQL